MGRLASRGDGELHHGWSPSLNLSRKLPSSFPRTHIQQTIAFYSLLIHGVCFTSSPVCLAPSSCSPPCESFSPGRTATAPFDLNLSFPVWGVCLISCSRAQHTSNAHAAHIKRRSKSQKGGNMKSIRPRGRWLN